MGTEQQATAYLAHLHTELTDQGWQAALAEASSMQPSPATDGSTGAHSALAVLGAALPAPLGGRVVQPHPARPPALRVVDPDDPDRSEQVHLVADGRGRLWFTWSWLTIGPAEDVSGAARDIARVLTKARV
jgi:hypothetical protein